MKYAFAGDREISCNLLKFIMAKGYKPSIILVTNNKNTTHASELIAISGLSAEKVIIGKEFSSAENLEKLKTQELDYIIGIHFPYIIPIAVLNCPKIGFLNLHPAYLPYNKGWHTPSWAILEDTKYGATLHFMAEELDAGDIVHQKELILKPEDTANNLYQRVLKVEEEVFIEAFDDLLSLNPKREKQKHKGTSHNKKDLMKINEIKLDEKVNSKNLINLLRALTTNNIEESAYFIENGNKYNVQINITKLE